MRGNKGRFGSSYNGVYGNHLQSGNITVHNSYYTSVSYTSHVGHHAHGKPKHDRRKEVGDGKKKPELLGFCSTLGLADQHKVAKMSDGELIAGTAEVCGYALKSMGNDARTVGRGVSEMATGIGQMVHGTFRFIANLLK